jgi:hypothetical protein
MAIDNLKNHLIFTLLIFKYSFSGLCIASQKKKKAVCDGATLGIVARGNVSQNLATGQIREESRKF